MKLKELTRAMENFNRIVAAGSECNAWGDYHADCYEVLGIGPCDEYASDLPEDFAEYWLAVAEGENGDYCPQCGDRLDAGAVLE